MDKKDRNGRIDGRSIALDVTSASVFAPRGISRSYANQGEEVSRVLIICSPGIETDRDFAHQTQIVGPPLEV